MAEATKVVKIPDLSVAEFQLLTVGLTMLRTSRLRAVQAEIDENVRQARQDSAGAISALLVKLSNSK